MAKKITLLSPVLIDKTFTPADLTHLLLQNRKINPDKYQSFLKPPFPVLKLPLKNILTLISHFQAGQKNILIYGDYDVDGISATCLIWRVLYPDNPHVYAFIPHREIDGYGFKADSFFRLQKEKGIIFDLLITVDNGIVASKEFSKVLSRQFLEIIVIDHHLADNQPQNNIHLVYSPQVSGAALAWFVAREIDSKADLGLAALGTVSDCLPLTGVNRQLVVHGLKSLRLNPNPGLKKLIEISSIKIDSLSVYDLGFILGPRLNAVGRLDSPQAALNLLCSQDAVEAEKYAKVLNLANSDRQSLQKDSLIIAERQADPRDLLIFIANNSFHPGIIGLIAGRLTEKYHLPSVVISLNGPVAKGSCRSIPELNIIDALREHGDLFVDLGGHPLAAGFSILEKNIESLREKLIKYVKSKLTGLDLTPTIIVDAQMKLSAAKLPWIKAIKNLEPFGLGNPEPLFLFNNLRVTSKRLLGSTGDHLKLKLDDLETKYPENYPADAIGFKMGEYDKTLKVGSMVNIIARLDANIWNGLTTPQLIIKEIILL